MPFVRWVDRVFSGGGPNGFQGLFPGLIEGKVTNLCGASLENRNEVKLSLKMPKGPCYLLSHFPNNLRRRALYWTDTAQKEDREVL